MTFSIGKFLGRTLVRGSSTSRSGLRRRQRLTVQNLEDRVTPATFTVNNSLDDGSVGSLRWAIEQANAAASDDDIVFDSAAFATPQVISFASALPTIPVRAAA